VPHDPATLADSVSHFLEQWRVARPDLDPSSLGVTARMSRLNNHIIRRTEAALAPLGLSWEVFSLIVALRRIGPPYELRPGELLRESLLTSGAITNRVDRVEKLGFITRVPDPDDRRSVIVRLSAAGLAKADEAIELVFTAQRAFLSPLDKAEQAQLAELLARLNVAVENDPTLLHGKERKPEGARQRMKTGQDKT